MNISALRIALGLAANLLLAGCVGAGSPRSEALPALRVESQTPPVRPVRLAALADEVGVDGGLTEGAALQMLAFREQVYLPFRYRQGVNLDGRGWVASRDLESVREGFVRLGVDGLDVLGRCVDEAAQERVGSVHLAGDDGALLGRVCLQMMIDAYGRGSLPFLAELGRTPAVTPTATLLHRAALDVLPGLAPEATEVVRTEARDWRRELRSWSSWIKGEQLNLEGESADTEHCDAACEESLMRGWIVTASEHLVMPGIDAPEPRLVATLREYMFIRAERWVPWLGDASKDALARRDMLSVLQSGLLIDLWASVSTRYPVYFRTIVLPTLALEIRPRRDEGDDGRALHAQFVLWSLERAAGVEFEVASCGGAPSGEIQRRCLREQSRAWRRYAMGRTRQI